MIESLVLCARACLCIIYKRNEAGTCRCSRERRERKEMNYRDLHTECPTPNAKCQMPNAKCELRTANTLIVVPLSIVTEKE